MKKLIIICEITTMERDAPLCDITPELLEQFRAGLQSDIGADKLRILDHRVEVVK